MESPEKAVQETEPAEGDVVRFFEMTRADEIELREEIEKSEGLVRVFVHPYFEEYSEWDSVREGKEFDVEDLQKAEKAFKRLLSSDSDKLPPLFIFESGTDADVFEEKEERLSGLTKNDVYVVRTELASANPLPPSAAEKNYLSIVGQKSDITAEERNQMWEWLMDEWEDMGVERILAGGLELYAYDDPEHYGGCLGGAINKLRERFDVELSTLTAPSSRSDIKSNQ